MAGTHETQIGKENEWLTPPELIRSLGSFDLDPCAPVIRPWPTALNHYTIQDDGLAQLWFGRVWLNPPYNRYVIADWMQRMAQHNNGVSLVYARTDSAWFKSHVWPHAASILFMASRVTFYEKHTGRKAADQSTAPSVLIAYGRKNIDALDDSGIPGRHVLVNYTPVIVVGVTPTWYSVVSIAVRNFGHADLRPVYDMVERMAPDRIKINRHWKAKVRQQVQVIRKQSHQITLI